MLRWLRFGWTKTDATLIDRKFVRRDSYNVHHGGHYQVWDFMVELPAPPDRPKRLVTREKTFKLDLPENGRPVPILVNRRRTKAVFDLDNPRIDAVGRLDRKQRRRRERDELRFEERLRSTVWTVVRAAVLSGSGSRSWTGPRHARVDRRGKGLGGDRVIRVRVQHGLRRAGGAGLPRESHVEGDYHPQRATGLVNRR